MSTKLQNLFMNVQRNLRIFDVRNLFSSRNFNSQEMLKDNIENVSKLENQKSSNYKTLIIEGNIGCGKSTMLEIFGNKPDVEAVPEQVERWTNWNGRNMLQAMYDDPIKYGEEFQNIVIKTMVENHLKQTTKRIKLQERSLFSTEACFIKNSYQDKVFTRNQFQSLSEKCQNLRKDLQISADCILYMRISPEVALHRIKARGRDGEENISLDLLTKLHILHEEYIMSQKIPVAIVDANRSLDDVISQFNDILVKW